MTILHGFAGQWMARALGWTLLHFCWQGAVIGATLWCALQLLGRRSAQTRYVAACVALGMMMLAPLATLLRVGTAEYRLSESGAGVQHAAGQVYQAGLGDAAGPWLAELARALDPAAPWVSMLWLAGAAIFLLRLSVGFRVTQRMRSTAVSQVTAELKQTFDKLTLRLGVRRAVGLMQSGLVEAPTVVGWLRPAVLLPVSCFTGLSQTQIEAVLCHELAHVMRHDYLVSVLQSVVEALLFYHPAVWWVSRELRRERECCCDDAAVTVSGDALAYARTLAVLETRRVTYPQVMLGADGGVLTMRIKRLLGFGESSVAAKGAAMVLLAVLVTAAVVIGSTARAQAKQSDAVSMQAEILQPVVAEAVMTKPLTTAVTKLHAKRSTAAPEEASDRTATTQPQGQGEGGEGLGVGTKQSAGGPVKVAGGVLAEQLISKTAPVYPAEAKAAHVQGSVVLQAVISKTGDVEQLQVISGPNELTASALDAVRQWKYRPYLLNGEPVEVETTITVNYHIGGMPDLPPAPMSR